MLLSLIVPCYNEQEALPLFYRETTSVLREMDCDYELILVNDGSKDKTLSVMKGLAAADPCVFYYSFSRNFGKEAAMYAGFCNARGDYVAVMDADLQDPPSLLPEMVRILESGEYDSVATRRADRAGEPPVRSWFAHNRFSKGIFGWVGFKTYWLPYENVERVAGQTKWNFWKLFKYAIDGIINFSNAPLSIASWFGMLMTVVSFLFLIFIVVRRLIWGDPVAGWASTICVIIFIGGLQLFCLGIIGQYLAKTYMEVKHRPHYIISDTNAEHAQKIR